MSTNAGQRKAKPWVLQVNTQYIAIYDLNIGDVKRHCGCCGFWPLTLARPWLKQPHHVCLSIMYLRGFPLRGSWGLLLSAVPLPAVRDPVLARQPAQSRRLTDIQMAVHCRPSLHVT